MRVTRFAWPATSRPRSRMRSSLSSERLSLSHGAARSIRRISHRFTAVFGSRSPDHGTLPSPAVRSCRGATSALITSAYDLARRWVTESGCGVAPQTSRRSASEGTRRVPQDVRRSSRGLTTLRERRAEERDVAVFKPVEIVGGPRVYDDPALPDSDPALIDVVNHPVSG
jgi:hypothetical protein